MVAASVILFFGTYPGKYTDRITLPALAELIGIPVLLVFLAGLLFICYLCRSWLAVGIVVVALVVGILSGSWREAKANRREAQLRPEYVALLNRTRSEVERNWPRHKLLAGVSVASLALSAAMLKDKV
ncbi:MAG: hypothetical protein R3C11_22235 [Planctomycetaceae bacterium]